MRRARVAVTAAEPLLGMMRLPLRRALPDEAAALIASHSREGSRTAGQRDRERPFVLRLDLLAVPQASAPRPAVGCRRRLQAEGRATSA
jgi:hypothetical protein